MKNLKFTDWYTGLVELIVHAAIWVIEGVDRLRKGNPLKKGAQRTEEDEQRADTLRRKFKLRRN